MKEGLRKLLIIAAYILVFWGLLPLGLWAFGGFVDTSLDLPQLSPALWRPAGAVIAVLGVGVLVWSMTILMSHGRGLPISHLPPTKLVARGPYAFVQHPIYVGYTIAFSGVGLASLSLGRGLASAALLTLGWVLYTRLLEEPALRRRFGDDHRSYQDGFSGDQRPQ